MAACGRLSMVAAAADREARGGGVTELGREGPEMVEVVVRVPSDGMDLFKGVARRWSGRGGSVPAGERRGAPLMALRPLARVVTRRAGGEDDGTAGTFGKKCALKYLNKKCAVLIIYHDAIHYLHSNHTS